MNGSKVASYVIPQAALNDMDNLKRALEQLEPPYCPKCKIEMKWSRSTLVDVTTVTHIFVCPACSDFAETKTTVKGKKVVLAMGSDARMLPGYEANDDIMTNMQILTLPAMPSFGRPNTPVNTKGAAVT